MAENLRHTLTAYEVGYTEGWEICCSEVRRSWMDQTSEGFAYRCLPMTIANQAGWIIRCPADFTVVWNGGGGKDSIRFEFVTPGSVYESQILSHFGTGIITFTIPYLFRTSVGVGLIVRGIPNDAKSNCSPLEGVVESDWNLSTFTMNWRILQPGTAVAFAKGEPICFLQPCDLGLMEGISPEVKHLDSSPQVAEAYRSWAASRLKFNASPTRGKDWQKHYHQGTDPDGNRAPMHRTKLNLRQFRRPD